MIPSERSCGELGGRISCWAVILVAAATGLGCAGPATSPIVARTETVAPAADLRSMGTLVMIPGIVGQPSELAGMRDGIESALRLHGTPLHIEVIPWETSAFQPIRNLTDYEANLVRARRIADRLTEIHRQHPGAPLVLLGNSGGGGLAVMAAEMLPEDVMLDRLILTAAAVSHDYDLKPARARCRRIVNFFSRADGIVGWGTSLFGTIDRKNTLAAGHCGFLNEDGSLLADRTLTQVEWRLEWLPLGHDGSHLGYRSREWARIVLSPYVTGANEDDVATASAM